MAVVIDGKEHVTATMAAAKLDTTMTRILMLLKAKALQGVQIDGEWFVTSDSLDCAKTHGSDLKVANGCASHCSSGGCGCK